MTTNNEKMGRILQAGVVVLLMAVMLLCGLKQSQKRSAEQEAPAQIEVSEPTETEIITEEAVAPKAEPTYSINVLGEKVVRLKVGEEYVDTGVALYLKSEGEVQLVEDVIYIHEQWFTDDGKFMDVEKETELLSSQVAGYTVTAERSGRCLLTYSKGDVILHRLIYFSDAGKKTDKKINRATAKEELPEITTSEENSSVAASSSEEEDGGHKGGHKGDDDKKDDKDKDDKDKDDKDKDDDDDKWKDELPEDGDKENPDDSEEAGGDGGNSENPGLPEDDQKENPGDSGEAGQPGDSGESGQPGDSGESGQPGDSGEAGQPGDSGESGQPGDSGEIGLPSGEEPGNPGDSEEAGQNPN